MKNQMRSFSITYVKAHFSRLVDEASKGNGFVITKRGVPIVKVMAFPQARK
jgi:prevent-host-death family protein